MSYSQTTRYAVPGRRRAFYGLGSTLTINVATGNDPTRAVQAILQRLNFLDAGTGPTGQDGKWGPRTSLALESAARYVGYAGTPFTVSGTTVTIPDDLMALLQSATPANPAQVQTITAAPSSLPVSTVTASTTSTTSTSTNTSASSDGTVPVLAIGIGVIVVAGLAAWAMSSTNIKIEEPTKYKTKYQTRRTYIPVAVHRNRGRSRRR